MLCYLFCVGFVSSIDSDKPEHQSRNLGRIDFYNMCDQQRMEKLVEELGNISMFMNNVDDGDYKDVFDWPGVH